VKVLLISHIFPPAVDGGSRVIAKIGEYLQKKGHQVLVLTTNCHSSDDFSKLSYQKLKHTQKNVISKPVFTMFHRPFKFLGRYIPNFKTLSKGPLFSPLSFFSLLNSGLKYRPDIILAGPLPTTIVLYARLVRYLSTRLFHFSPKIIINASFHSTDPDFHTPLLINTLKSADFIWTLTDSETNYFQKILDIPKSKLIFLGNGVDKSFLSPAHLNNFSSNHLLFIGSFSAHKDIPTLIKAFSLLPSNFNLTLAGQKTLYFPVIHKQIKSLSPSIKKRIKVISSFSNSYLSTLLDNCTILISPSLQESFGLVLIEAMARSRPVIAADIPASSELISKSKGGLLFKAGDEVDLKNKILKLSSSPKLHGSLSKNGFTYVSNHCTWDKIILSLEKQINEIQ